MTDRFYGFRFELFGNGKLDNEVLESIQMEADNYACFGWTQLSEKGTVVGEARCSKARGKVLEDKIAKISNKIKDAKILVYPDTKIRLHFSYFKILEPERDTCFIDAPHQCSEYVDKPEKVGHSNAGEL
eukprot:gene36925-44797_t